MCARPPSYVFIYLSACAHLHPYTLLRVYRKAHRCVISASVLGRMSLARVFLEKRIGMGQVDGRRELQRNRNKSRRGNARAVQGEREPRCKNLDLYSILLCNHFYSNHPKYNYTVIKKKVLPPSSFPLKYRVYFSHLVYKFLQVFNEHLSITSFIACLES